MSVLIASLDTSSTKGSLEECLEQAKRQIEQLQAQVITEQTQSQSKIFQEICKREAAEKELKTAQEELLALRSQLEEKKYEIQTLKQENGRNQQIIQLQSRAIQALEGQISLLIEQIHHSTVRIDTLEERLTQMAEDHKETLQKLEAKKTNPWSAIYSIVSTLFGPQGTLNLWKQAR